MHLIKEEQTYKSKFSKIESIIKRKAQLPDQVFRDKPYWFKVIDFDEIYSRPFFDAVNNFLEEERGSIWTFAVLENDPEEFFFNRCKKYPIFEINISDSFENYQSITRGELECIPNESLADNAYVIVVYPESLKWVIYGDFDFEIGIIGFWDNETIDIFISKYSKGRVFTMGEAIPSLLETIYPNNVIPEDIRTKLLSNYE